MAGARRKRFLERAALRKAQKALRQKNGKNLSREDIGALRIQTMNPWIRITAIVIGLVCWAAPWILDEWPPDIGFVIFFGVIGLLCIGIGALGKKNTVEAVLNGVGDAALSRLLDAIF